MRIRFWIRSYSLCWTQCPFERGSQAAPAITACWSPPNRPFFLYFSTFSREKNTFRPLDNLIPFLDPLLSTIGHGVEVTHLGAIAHGGEMWDSLAGWSTWQLTWHQARRHRYWRRARQYKATLALLFSAFSSPPPRPPPPLLFSGEAMTLPLLYSVAPPPLLPVVTAPERRRCATSAPAAPCSPRTSIAPCRCRSSRTSARRRSPHPAARRLAGY